MLSYLDAELFRWYCWPESQVKPWNREACKRAAIAVLLKAWGVPTE